MEMKETAAVVGEQANMPGQLLGIQFDSRPRAALAGADACRAVGISHAGITDSTGASRSGIGSQ
jgi:hypothetical protein